MWGWVEREAEGGVANGTLCFGLQAVLNSKPSGETISLIASLKKVVAILKPIGVNWGGNI